MTYREPTDPNPTEVDRDGSSPQDAESVWHDSVATPSADALEAPSGWSGVSVLERFLETIHQLGLVDDSEVRLIRKRISEDGLPGSALMLANQLVQQGKLTKYQVAAIQQEKTRGLAIGNYVVLEKIGSGGMGIVFKARHRKLNRVVALKLLPPSFSRDPGAVLRFRRETEAIARFRHPNIVSALDAGESSGLLFLVLEFVEGKDLSRLVREKGPLAVNQAVQCIIQAARGLDEAHAHGIVHRDIKPANLLLDRAGTVKLLDLGLARINPGSDPLNTDGSELNLTVSGAIVGTVDYMSPEQAYNPKLADARSDVYSLGCTLHYLLTGKAPYGGESFMQRLIAHRERPIPSLTALRRDVPPALDSVFRAMMAKSPESRPQSMKEVIAELENCRSTPRGNPSGKLQVFDDRSEQEKQRDQTYGIVGKVASDDPSSSRIMGNVFVRSRSSSDDHLDLRPRRSIRTGRRIAMTIIAGLAVVLILLLAARWKLV